VDESPSVKTVAITVSAHRIPLSDQTLEPLLRTGLTTFPAANVGWEWSNLPVADQRYEVHSVFARGGMGSLHAATDKVLGRRVAIKVLCEEMREDPEAVVRFFQEARIHAQFHHQGIPPLHDVGRLADGRPFIAMKFIRGRTVTSRLDDPDPPGGRDWAWWRGVFEQTCRAVGYAHSKGVIHRDLTPNNVLVSDRGRVQVIDWGLAKVFRTPADGSPCDEGTTRMTIPNLSSTGEGHVLGTPAYMPPEATDAGAAGPQTDVFGLGGILCHMLTGRPPFDGARSTVLRRVKAGDLAPAVRRLDACEGPDGLVRLAKACLSPDLDQRPSGVGDVLVRMADPPAAPPRSWWRKLFDRKGT
jgi:serine/threonine protein kinase